MEPFLASLRVVELGDRLATGLCGGLLQRLGAEVAVIAPGIRATDPETKWPYGDELSAGKRHVDASVAGDAAASLVASADVALLSSDWCDGLPAHLRRTAGERPVVCDMTAFGSSGPLAGRRHSDALMQAYSGLAACTGAPDGDPVFTRLPVTECSAAVYAAAGVLAALRAGTREPGSRRVEVALFDTALTLLSTFLPAHFVGQAATRIGNRHPSMSPWNAYRASDGWLLLCSASNDMWLRVCEVIGRPELGRDPRFADMPGRVRHAEEVDECLRPWIARREVDACVAAFTRAGVPCGPIYSTAALLDEPTLRARGAIVRVGTGEHARAVPGALIHGAPACSVAPNAPMKTVSAASWASAAGEAAASTAASNDPRPALRGLRVLEMGNYTTAPLAARQLGALGADVVKLEPRSGELSRASPPHRDGQSYFFTLSNSDKRSVVIDLAADADRTLFHALLARADVFVENMKPGVLARYGFGAADIAQRHPRLVYCSVSGFGADTPLADRPAMDATIQGMAGIMDLTRGAGVPYKIGASICDILGGEFALLAVLAGLAYRDRSGRGTCIDLSMQELSAWLTQLHWNAAKHEIPVALAACRDGHVLAVGADVAQLEASSTMSRDELAARLNANGIHAVPVQSVNEAAACEQARQRALIVMGDDRRGRTWPLLACPIRLPGMQAVRRRAPGGIGEDREDVLRDWGIEPGQADA